jgi:putative inorganic carbon (hco3(-)) transporter
LSFYVGYITAFIAKKTLVWPQPFYGFINVRLFQQYQLWGLGIICLPLISYQLNHKKRIWLFIALTCWWVLLFHAASRGAILGWVIAIIATLIFYRKAAWSFIRIQLINASTGLITYLALFKIIPILTVTNNAATKSTTSTIFRATSSGRIELWQDALEMISNSPFFGVGPMNYYWNSKLPEGTYPHNSILQTASEFGLPATFIILAIFGYCFFAWFKRFNLIQLKTESAFNRNLSVIFFFTMIANGTYSLFSGVTVMPISQVLMFTLIGLMIGQYSTVENMSSINHKFKFRPIFALVILATLSWSTFPELKRGLTSYNRIVGEYERQFSMAPDTIVPRIWMQQNKLMDEPKD